MNVLEIRNLCKAYPRFTLDHVSFDVEQGHIVGFIGRNGAGKTTTLSSLLNLVHPDSGEISFFGRPLTGSEREIKQRIGFVSGGIDYYPRRKLSVIADVTRRFYDNWDDAAYRACLGRFGLDERKTPSELSAGMKVKFALTLALSLRFIPVIEREFDTVRAAQKSRGAELSGSLAHKLAMWGAAFSAVFIGLFRHANNLALAMDARCYGVGEAKEE